jgi:hypothetical protein
LLAAREQLRICAARRQTGWGRACSRSGPVIRTQRSPRC